MINKRFFLRCPACMLLIILLLCMQIPAASDLAVSDPPVESENTIVPGTYLLAAYAEKENACSIPEDIAKDMAESALSYCLADGTNRCIVVEQDHTARQYMDEGYITGLFEDGFFYTVTGGESYVNNGPVIAIGYENTDFNWSVYYRLTPEQASLLSYPEENLAPGTSPVKIPIYSDQEYGAFMSVVMPVLDEGGDPNEVYDEILLSIDQVHKDTQEQEEDRLLEEAMWNQSQLVFTPEQFETFEETQMTMAHIMQLNQGAVPVGVENGQVNFIGGTCTEEPVEDIWDAMEVLENMISLLGGDASCEFEPWGVLEDSLGNQYYTFQQFKNAVSVSGGAVKIAVNKDHRMTGIFSSIVTDLPEEEPDPVPYTELQDIVRSKSGFAPDALTFYEGTTDVTLLPLIIDPDPVNDEPEDSTSVRYVWIVYTDNPSDSSGSAENYPYLAHYITQEGEYLYHTAVISPGDPAAVSGFSAEYAFTGMEPDTWTGSLVFPDGKEQTVTLPVMKNSETGTYCLADPERKIVMADCYDFLYNDYQVTLVSSETNEDWDPYYLNIYYNMIRVWDFYQETGWNGADGEDTPILIMVDYCDDEHEPVDNAAYTGLIHGWQTFGFSNSNIYGKALDVVAHEFTHCVTGKSMTFNSYQNDYGAINESISDILGNICEFFYDETEEPLWLIAEDAGTPLRSMSDPHLYSQPEAVWDLYYIPHVSMPTRANDRGGVHINSSILNRIASRLWKEAGMSLEESRSFWTSVECAMVPGTNFSQLSIVLPWVMEEIGLGQYTQALKEFIAQARLSETSLPAQMGEEEAMIILELPENEMFTDGYWLLYLLDLNLFGNLKPNAEHPEEKYLPVYNLGHDGTEPETDDEIDAEEVPTEAAEEDEEEASDEDSSFLSDLMKHQFSGAGTDNHTIRMKTKTGDKMLLLVHLSEDNLSDPDTTLILSNGAWKEYHPDAEGGAADLGAPDAQTETEDPFHQSNEEIFTVRQGYNVLPSAGLDRMIP